MAKEQMKKILAGLAGEYLVAGHLCLKGYVPSLTFKNYPEVDIFYLNPANGKNGALQIKTIRDGKKYFIPESVDKSPHPFVFVRINSDESVEFFIVPAKEVAKRSEEARKEFHEKHPNASEKQPRMLSIRRIESFKDRWELLALD